MTRAVLATFASTAAAFATLPAAAGALTLGVTTKSPQDVATTSATMRADVTVPVLGASVTWQYGTTTRYGGTTGAVAASLLGLSETLTLPATGLTPGTTYHVRAVAASALTTSYGRDITFTTDRAKASGGSGGSSGDPDPSGSEPGGSGSPGSGSSTTTTTPAAATDPPAPGPTKTAEPAASHEAAGQDPAAAIPPGSATADVTPALGKTVAIAAVQGKVTATTPAGAPVDLSGAQAVPTGTLIDTRAGTVELTTALDTKGATQTGRFWGALFEVRQGALARGVTQLVLRGADFSACGPASTIARARAAAKATKKKKPARTLWGSDDHGRFQTRGRGSVATVRGTRWMTRDTCAGTLTRVTAGAVAVEDLRRHATVVVKRGREYLARVG
jgi:hypothetical protein